MAVGSQKLMVSAANSRSTREEKSVINSIDSNFLPMDAVVNKILNGHSMNLNMEMNFLKNVPIFLNIKHFIFLMEFELKIKLYYRECFVFSQ
jgi:hypothetical protein